jgi:photosystem II PsbY protein
MDLRILIVILPLVLALAWVAKNIGQAALKQGKEFIER